MAATRNHHGGKSLHDPSRVPFEAASALQQAMQLEGISPADYPDFLWIMAQESMGISGVQKGTSSASGLFQLVQTQRQEFYPNGNASVGNPVEEAQGGIRYIISRYGTASAARAFSEKHHWY